MKCNRDRVIDIIKEMEYYGNIPKGDGPLFLSNLENQGFFVKPGSIHFHHNYAGGLLEHSLEVMDILLDLNIKLNLGLSDMAIKRTALFHDLCKCNDYVIITKFQSHNITFDTHPSKEPGHGTKSIELLRRLGIELGEEEIQAIENHMGAFRGPLSELSRVYNEGNVLAYWLHVADMLSANPKLKGCMNNG